MDQVNVKPEDVLKKHFECVNGIIDAANEVINMLTEDGIHPVDIYRWASLHKHAALKSEVINQPKMFEATDSESLTSASVAWLQNEYTACVAMLIMSSCYANWPEFGEEYAKIRLEYKSKSKERRLKPLDA